MTPAEEYAELDRRHEELKAALRVPGDTIRQMEEMNRIILRKRELAKMVFEQAAGKAAKP